MIRQIENVVIAIEKLGNKTHTIFYVPQGVSGIQFGSFKVRNGKLIHKLKTEGDGNDEIIKIEAQEDKYTTAHSLPIEFGKVENFQDNPFLRGIEVVRRRSKHIK